MRTIKDMLENEEKVWLYIDNEELWGQFLTMAEDFHFGVLPRDQWVFGHVNHFISILYITDILLKKSANKQKRKALQLIVRKYDFKKLHLVY